MGDPSLVARDVGNGRVLARVEVATSFLARAIGLIGRAGLEPDEALWLPGANGIHMVLMRFPIDCCFLGRPAADGSRQVVAVRPDLPPWRGLVPFVRGVDGALELPAGALARAGIRVGDRIELIGEGGARH